MRQGIKIMIFIAAILGCGKIFAQNTDITFGENSIEYKKQILAGVILHSQGFGAGMQFAKSNTAFKRRMIGVEIVTMKHPKEYKISNPYVQDSKRYVYGKLNSFMLLRSTYGFKYLKFEKFRKSGVELSYGWHIGPVLGLVKPVYLEIIRQDEGFSDFYLSVERADPNDDYQRIENIYGRASFLRGFDKLMVVPGLHFKLNGIFEYSQFTEGIKGLEIGFTGDLFPKKIPILANNLNTAAYFKIYLNLFIGKKYNDKLANTSIDNSGNGIDE